MNNEVLFLYTGCNQPIDEKGIIGIPINRIDDLDQCGVLPASSDPSSGVLPSSDPVAGPSSDPVAGPSSGRISNSKPSDVHYPWVVMVSRTFTFNTEGTAPYTSKCGGTIINDR